MNTYLINGTILFGDYCECPDCKGHFHDKLVKDYTVDAKNENEAMESALLDLLHGGDFDDAEWKSDCKVSIVAWDTEVNGAEGVLLAKPPEALEKRALAIGLAAYWQMPVTRSCALVRA